MLGRSSDSYRRQWRRGEVKHGQPGGVGVRVLGAFWSGRRGVYKSVHGANKHREKIADLIEFGSDTASGEREQREGRGEVEVPVGVLLGWSWARCWAGSVAAALFIFF